MSAQKQETSNNRRGLFMGKIAINKFIARGCLLLFTNL